MARTMHAATRRLMIIAVSLITCGAFGQTPGGRTLDAAAIARLESHVNQAIADGDIPGAVVLIGDSRGDLYRRAFGNRSLAPAPEPMTGDTIFDAASLTKPVATATAIHILADAGVIDLDAPASRYLPTFTGNGKERITIAQLLTHTAGLTPDNALADYNDGRDEAWRRIDALDLHAPPGERFIYSDVGFIVLGRIVERITGKPLDAYAAERIFQPLGMRDTGFNPDPSLRPRIAPTERQDDGAYLRGTVHDPRSARLGGVAGHAGMFTTAGDLARFCRMILGRGSLGGVRVLSPEAVGRMTAPRYLPDGSSGRTLGFDMDSRYSSSRGNRFPRGESFGHTGFTGTMIWIDPVDDLFVIMLTNRLHTGNASVVPLYRAVSTAAAEAVLGPGPDPTVVMTGIDVLARDGFAPLRGRRVGLITNHTGLDRTGRRTIDLLHEAPNVDLVALFSPEHGLYGRVDERVGHATDTATGLRVWSLYGETRRPTDAMLQGIDTLVFDIQDIGTRFYTYIATMGYAMEEAARRGIRFVVLDRPNPIAPLGVRGPTSDADQTSFIAYRPLPLTHGMTVGELARLFNDVDRIGCDLHVITMTGWRHDMWLDQTGLTWVNPSPNMRNPEHAVLYPAVGMLEYTNLSVGRGTDEPFERLGAPWIDPSPDVGGHRRLAAALNAAELPGVRVVPITFTPDASKFAGETCGGVHLILTDRDAFDPPRTGLTIAHHLRRLFGGAWEHEQVVRLLGSAAAHRAWQSGEPLDDDAAVWRTDAAAFEQLREPYLIYP